MTNKINWTDKELIGKKIGKLKVIARYGTDKSKHTTYLCHCDCGKDTIKRGTQLRTNSVVSCGCYIIETTKKRLTKHGHYGERLYNIWQGIKKRTCLQDKREATRRNYWGRGISVCKEWANSFSNFYNWAMANGYKDDLSIDRIDNNGNYEPSNCRWATNKEQSRNTRTNRIIEYKGQKRCLAEWCDILHITKNAMRGRMNRGMTFEQAVNFKNTRNL